MAMRNLILIRHSYAESRSDDGDMGRELSEHGVEKLRSQIKRLGDFPKVELAHISPAKRTKQTFELLNEYLNVANNMAWIHNDIYNGSYLDYAQLLSLSPVELNTVVLIAHNPSLSYLASKLCSEFNNGFNPGDILWLRAELKDWDVIHAKWSFKNFLSE